MSELTDDVYGSYNFLLELSGIHDDHDGVKAGFSGVSGGGIKIDKRDVTVGNSPQREYEAGPVEFENITLSRGLTENTDLVDWLQDFIDGKGDKVDGSIIQLDNDESEVRRWEFFGAFPVSWSGVELSGDGSAVHLEKFELAVGSLKFSL
jgi:phage tail-like protein